jgi:ParB/RepB/Spo0J family partition protein
MEMREIELGKLRAHPMNSNVMAPGRFEKLVRHIERSGQYPPVIVRPRKAGDGEDGETFEVLDGHHRWRALERLGRAAAMCVVWDVDDAQALVLLATLNRLQGADDPRKRAAIIEELAATAAGRVSELAKVLPESVEELKRFLKVRAKLPRPVEPRGLGEMPVAVTFFLTGKERDELESRLKEMGGRREEGLMKLVRGVER